MRKVSLCFLVTFLTFSNVLNVFYYKNFRINVTQSSIIIIPCIVCYVTFHCKHTFNRPD